MDIDKEQIQEMNLENIGKSLSNEPILTGTPIVKITNEHTTGGELEDLAKKYKEPIIMENKIQGKVVAGKNKEALNTDLSKFLESQPESIEIVSTNLTGEAGSGLYMTILYKSKLERV